MNLGGTTMSIVPYEDDGLFLLPFASLPELKKGEIIMIYPSIEEAKKKYSEYNVFPVVREILSDSFTPIHIFKALKRNEENAFILESVNNGNQWGRYSFIGINPKRDVTVHKIMGRTGTLDVSERLIKNLSKGYKQRVGLAAAMLGDPEILILDEPTVGLDPKQIIEMRELIRDLSHHHTLLLSSHIMQEISAVCDEIIVINEGHMIAKDTPDNLTREMVEKNGIHLVAKGTKDKIKTALRTVPGIRDVKYDTKNEEGTLGLTLYMTPGAEIREDIFYAMVKADCPIYELHPLAASLEDAFLALTRGGSRQYGGQKTKNQAAKAEETAQEAQTQTVESASATQEQQKEEE